MNARKLFYSLCLAFPIVCHAPLLCAQGTVQLRNVSYPFTKLEVGDYVAVTITGAAPNGTVTFVQNGGSPYVWGMTDNAGNWSTPPGLQESGSNVGDYYQTWYVNGVPVTPNNPDTNYFSYAPSLPSFSVGAGAFPSDPSVLTFVYACGGDSNVTAKWIWTPVGYAPETSYGSSVVDAAAQNWNNAQTKLSLALRRNS